MSNEQAIQDAFSVWIKNPEAEHGEPPRTIVVLTEEEWAAAIKKSMELAEDPDSIFGRMRPTKDGLVFEIVQDEIDSDTVEGTVRFLVDEPYRELLQDLLFVLRRADPAQIERLRAAVHPDAFKQSERERFQDGTVSTEEAKTAHTDPEHAEFYGLLDRILASGREDMIEPLRKRLRAAVALIEDDEAAALPAHNTKTPPGDSGSPKQHSAGQAIHPKRIKKGA